MRAAALTGMAQTGCTAEASLIAEAALAEPDWQLRQAAAYALSATDPGAAVDALITATRDDNRSNCVDRPVTPPHSVPAPTDHKQPRHRGAAISQSRPPTRDSVRSRPPHAPHTAQHPDTHRDRSIAARTWPPLPGDEIVAETPIAIIRRVSAEFLQLGTIIVPMPARHGYGGRPSLGPRRRMMTALRPHEAEWVEQRATEADTTFSDVIAELVRIGIAHANELPAHIQPKEALHLSETA